MLKFVPLNHAQIAAMIPHAGNMCLLDAVTSWDENQIVCQANSHRDLQNPLRTAGNLSILAGIEYAAQAMAVHGRLLADNAGRAVAERFPAGRLVSARGLLCSVARLDDISDNLRIQAQRVMGDDHNLLYTFFIQEHENILIEGRVSVLIADNTSIH